MSLTLRRQREPKDIAVRDARGVFCLEGEHPWVVEGPAHLIDIAFADLCDVSTRVHAEVLHLDFGNTVGVFRVRDLGTLEVVSGKWEVSHFDAMLAEIAKIASALPFAAGTAGPLPYDRTLSTRDDLLYHCYVYVRHILSETAPRHVRLLPALRAILAEPHRRALEVTVDVPIEQIQRVDEATVLAVASGRGPLVRCRAAGRMLPSVLDGHLPRVLPEKQFRTTVNTPENRFVKGFIGMIASVISRTREACTKDKRFSHRIRVECRGLEDVLAPFERHPMWCEVGAMTQVPASSTVLQRRRGYRDVFRHFILMRLATRHLPISSHEARDLLEGRDIASLYELWCYFKVVDVLRDILGAPSSVDSVKRTDLQVHVAREFEVKWPNGTRALYNATFSSKRSGHRVSYSLPLRPDIVIVLADGAVHVLDAKFKLAWLDASEDDLDRADVKLEDVYKMHAYRDAIDAACSAWVLYPGTEFREYPADATGGVTGVGALPLRPEANGQEELTKLLRRMLGCPA